MNPIKTPREMLFEMLGVPHMAGGKTTVPFTLADQVAKAVAAFTRKFGKAPSPEDVKALEAYARNQANPTSGLRTGASARPRAQHELATDPNLINPDTARDEFLLQSMTGRGQKGTRLAPKVYDVNDPVTVQRIEGNQLAGAYDDLLEGKEFGDITPGATFFANQAAGIENAALSAGNIPLIDQLKMQFYKVAKRFPDEDELNAIIADYNPARHQHGAQGVSIMSSRPPTAKGMKEFRTAARNEGIPESFLQHRAGNYPKYIQDELEIQRGKLPGVAPRKERARKGSAPTPGSTITKFDEMGNPLEVQQFKDGRKALNPDQMRFDMAAMGYAPSKFADPYQAAMADMAARRANPVSPSALARMKAQVGRGMSATGRALSGKRVGQAFGALGAGAFGSEAANQFEKGDTLGAGLNLAGAGASAATMIPKYATKAIPVAGAAMAPISAKEAYDRYQQGDRSGAVISAIRSALNVAQAVPHPLVSFPAMGADIALGIYDETRQRPGK